MHFTAKFVSLLSVVATTALAAAVNVTTPASPDSALAPLNVIFYDDTGYRGSAYSPDELVVGKCFTLPDRWLSRSESVQISAGNTCLFFKYPACIGAGYALTGNVPTLPTHLYNNVDSVLCTKL